MQSMSGRGRKILPCAGFLLGGVLLQKPFIKIAEPLFARRKPVELVDRIRQRLEIGRLAEHGLRIHENRGDFRLALRAKVEKQALVIVELFEPGALGQLAPAIAVRQHVLAAGFGHHLEEKQEGQLGDILVVGHAVIAKDVTEIPELGDNVAGRR